MNRFNCALAAAVAVVFFTAAAPKVEAQDSVEFGDEPGCPYGYYDYAPYACAPDGYYSPEWFVGGVFIGAGPWFHGPAGFHGHVDNRFDIRHGYRGPMPNRGDDPDRSGHMEHMNHFSGNEMHDGHGHAGGGGGRR